MYKQINSRPFKRDMFLGYTQNFFRRIGQNNSVNIWGFGIIDNERLNKPQQFWKVGNDLYVEGLCEELIPETGSKLFYLTIDELANIPRDVCDVGLLPTQHGSQFATDGSRNHIYPPTHYKKLMPWCRLEAMDEGKELIFALLDVLHKAKLIKEEIKTDAQDAELIEICDALPAEKTDVRGWRDQAEIDEEMLCSEKPVESEDDNITVEEERKFMQQRSGKPGVMQAWDRLDNEMHVIRQKKMRQQTIP
ncbi:hypothetical protein RF11_16086 [Thelohanellus kitauei]|uniref:Uncharacterized protein n=1 Tax=Thelohanellus kitauei TaxID=669202 RepID=A0A0C2MVM6_THEKT|nr:hypothetical protein RF11_16086 [Thelohanellus kitauei]